MTVKINTKDGQIELSDDVIATVVGGSATEIFGVVGMASKSAIRDNFQALLGKENYAKGVVVKSTDAGIAVDVYTVMSYGVKISEVSKNIQERVKFNLENQLGIKTEKRPPSCLIYGIWVNGPVYVLSSSNVLLIYVLLNFTVASPIHAQAPSREM